MMRKYLVMSNGKRGEFAVAFNPTETHESIARRLGGVQFVLGAGEFEFHKDVEDRYHLRCFGQSISLRKASRGFDDALMLQYVLFDAGGADSVVIDNERPRPNG